MSYPAGYMGDHNIILNPLLYRSEQVKKISIQLEPEPADAHL